MYKLEVPYKYYMKLLYRWSVYYKFIEYKSLSIPFYRGRYFSVEQRHLIDSIEKYDRLKNENVFASLFAEKSLAEIYAILNDVVEGIFYFRINNI